MGVKIKSHNGRGYRLVGITKKNTLGAILIRALEPDSLS